MGADSSTGGYLTPTSPPPVADLALDVVLQGVIAGITGLPGIMVRPRVQPNDMLGRPVTPIPNADTDWCAVEVTNYDPDDMPAQLHVSDGTGYTVLRRSARLSVLASFFGPNSDYYANLASDALYIGQNREAMRSDGLNFISVDTIRRVPDIVNGSNRRRADLPMRFVQAIERRYEIQNILQADGTIRADASGRLENTPFLSPLPPA